MAYAAPAHATVTSQWQILSLAPNRLEFGGFANKFGLKLLVLQVVG
jgi:hypothetical protein